MLSTVGSVILAVAFGKSLFGIQFHKRHRAVLPLTVAACYAETKARWTKLGGCK